MSLFVCPSAFVLPTMLFYLEQIFCSAYIFHCARKKRKHPPHFLRLRLSRKARFQITITHTRHASRLRIVPQRCHRLFSRRQGRGSPNEHADNQPNRITHRYGIRDRIALDVTLCDSILDRHRNSHLHLNLELHLQLECERQRFGHRFSDLDCVSHSCPVVDALRNEHRHPQHYPDSNGLGCCQLLSNEHSHVNGDGQRHCNPNSHAHGLADHVPHGLADHVPHSLSFVVAHAHRVSEAV